MQVPALVSKAAVEGREGNRSIVKVHMVSLMSPSSPGVWLSSSHEHGSHQSCNQHAHRSKDHIVLEYGNRNIQGVGEGVDGNEN